MLERFACSIFSYKALRSINWVVENKQFGTVDKNPIIGLDCVFCPSVQGFEPWTSCMVKHGAG